MSSPSLFAGILDELITYLASVFHPVVAAGALRSIGSKLADQAHQQYKLRVPSSPPDSMRAFAEGAAAVALWPCNPTKIGPEEVVFEIETCPFGSHAVDIPQYCHLTGGFFGGLAEKYFDRAKVDVVKGAGNPPTRCRVTVLAGSLADTPSTGGELFARDRRGTDTPIQPPVDLTSLKPLSSRELTILRMIGEGLTAKEMAVSLDSSVRTIENTIARISQKLGVRGRARLIKFALQYSNPTLPLPKVVRRSSS